MLSSSWSFSVLKIHVFPSLYASHFPLYSVDSISQTSKFSWWMLHGARQAVATLVVFSPFDLPTSCYGPFQGPWLLFKSHEIHYFHSPLVSASPQPQLKSIPDPLAPTHTASKHTLFHCPVWYTSLFPPPPPIDSPPSLANHYPQQLSLYNRHLCPIWLFFLDCLTLKMNAL